MDNKNSRDISNVSRLNEVFTYDLACILCEVLISNLCFCGGSSFSAQLHSFLDSYTTIFDKESRKQIEQEITPHLAIQTIYRFLGPGRDSWTFYVDNEKRKEIIGLARALLTIEKPVSRAIEGLL